MRRDSFKSPLLTVIGGAVVGFVLSQVDLLCWRDWEFWAVFGASTFNGACMWLAGRSSLDREAVAK